MQKIDRQFINWIFEFSMVMVVSTILGNVLDEKFSTSPNILFLFLVLGLWLEGWNLYKIIKNYKEK